MRWPERELVHAKARAVYAEPRKPFLAEEDKPLLSLQQKLDDVLDLEDVSGKRQIETRLLRAITVRGENAAAALEIMSRFAVDPRWLIYLPPTMSPPETSRLPDLLEHPMQAFEYFRINGIPHVICEEKHMGSRAVVVVCKDHSVAQTRFGVVSSTQTLGTIYTRTGRPFFNDVATEQGLLERLSTAIDRAGLWAELRTDWLCLDCELMPWSAKAQSLIQDQYASVGVAAQTALSASVEQLALAATRLEGATELLNDFTQRQSMVSKYRDAYRRYCWNVENLDDLRLAPFHIMASDGKVHTDQSHTWHMETIAKLAATGDPIFVATPFRTVDLSSAQSEEEAVAWWTELTARGGEGMVVKPLSFIAKGARGIVQPAIKVRGPEYLRIIYGPEYTRPENIERLRSRAINAKRSLAHREFALGLESLERFVRREPLRRTHECVFAVLAMESEPVDPRL
jgi:protein phosphatase